MTVSNSCDKDKRPETFAINRTEGTQSYALQQQQLESHAA